MGIYERRQAIERVAQSEVKLTKAGEKFAKLSKQEITDMLIDSNENPLEVNYNEWLGIASNPNLTPEHLREMYRQMKRIATLEKKDETIAKATKTKNIGLREKVRRVLQEHPKLDDDAFKTLIMKYRTGILAVLQNPAIKPEFLQLFFNTHVLSTNYNYNYLAFDQLLTSKNITQQLLEDWYKTLKKFADWSYSDNTWYAIVRSYLQMDNCPYEVLVDVASAPNDGEEGWRSHSEPYREDAVNHKNADEKIKMLAYQHSGDEKYLPQIAKDVFLF